ncbi:hypothetical protein FKM82_017390 [Ascaphus truei]
MCNDFSFQVLYCFLYFIDVLLDLGHEFPSHSFCQKFVIYCITLCIGYLVLLVACQTCLSRWPLLPSSKHLICSLSPVCHHPLLFGKVFFHKAVD